MAGERELARGIPAGLSPAEGRKFGLVVGGAFLVLGLVLRLRDHGTASAVTLALGGALALAGLAIPGRLGPAYRGWMALARTISKVTTPVFMGAIYFLVLTPTGREKWKGPALQLKEAATISGTPTYAQLAILGMVKQDPLPQRRR